MTERDKRDAPISYRPPVALRAEFDARVARSGLSVSGFITEAVFGGDAPRQVRHAPVPQQEIARLLSETARLHDRLMAVGLDSGDAAVLEEAVRDLREIRAVLLAALGRKP